MKLGTIKHKITLAALGVSLLGLSGSRIAPNGGRAYAQSINAAPHCVLVGGSIMTNLGAIDPLTTMGTATGDLKGAVAGTILNVSPGSSPGALLFQILHHWVTESGDTILFPSGGVTETATPIGPGVFGLTADPLSIMGGTGKFSGATGVLNAFGAVTVVLDATGNIVGGQTVFRYSGQVCFAAPSNP